MNLQNNIFRDVVENSRLGRDEHLLAFLQQNYNAKSAIFHETEKLMKALDLQEFVAEITPEVGHVTKAHELRHEPLPVLTRKERRMSFDLMKPGIGTIRKRAQGRPAEASVSTVNVVTKVTDIESKAYVPVVEKSIKDRIKQFEDKIKSRNTVAPNPPLDIKKTRRTSVVGEHLPQYIRLQLASELTPKTALRTSLARSAQASITSDLPSRHSLQHGFGKTARIHNLLANSQSLYFRAENSQSSTENGIIDSVSDADKEYISPSLITRSLDYNDDDVLEGIYENSNSEEEEEDDEYLFTRR